MQTLLNRATEEVAAILPVIAELAPKLQKLGETMMDVWARRGKLLICGNGGSSCDAMHLSEELVARFQKNRRGLASIALCDPGVITCAGNDFGYESIFSRQVQALGNEGDLLIVFTTSGNSPNILRAIAQAEIQGMRTAAFLGKDGGRAKGLCDVELIVPATTSHRIQEAHQILYHTLCEWIDQRVD
jgi:D-sedoheptulose 7-phosphate isomerase